MARATVEGLDDLIGVCDRFLQGPEVGRVVERGAFNIKKDWRQRWSGLEHAPRLPYAVTYDVEYRVGYEINAEIGPVKEKRQGPLGNIIEFGSPTSAPHPGGLPALEAEEPKFVAALEIVMLKGLSG